MFYTYFVLTSNEGLLRQLSGSSSYSSSEDDVRSGRYGDGDGDLSPTGLTYSYVDGVLT